LHSHKSSARGVPRSSPGGQWIMAGRTWDVLDYTYIRETRKRRRPSNEKSRPRRLSIYGSWSGLSCDTRTARGALPFAGATIPLSSSMSRGVEQARPHELCSGEEDVGWRWCGFGD
jgi:hypothetical protein